MVSLRAGLRRKATLVAVAVLALILLAVTLGPILAPYHPNQQDLSASLAPPGFGGKPPHLLGTDLLGRDIFSRLLSGGRISLLVALTALCIQTTIGTTLGLAAGYRGGWLDQLIMRVADIQFALPGLVALLAVVAIFGPGLFKLILFLGLAGWPVYARIVRGQVLALREQGFVEAARGIGATRTRILIQHVLPNLLATIVVVTTIAVPYVILAEATLSFLGLGVQPPTATWGTMVNDGQEFLSTAWWISFFPGTMIFLLVLSVNFVGDGLRDILDPRTAREEAVRRVRRGGRAEAHGLVLAVEPPRAIGDGERLLTVRGLNVRFYTRDATVYAVTDVALDLAAGEVLGIVGESGCGKTVTSLAVMRLVPAVSASVTGSIRLAGDDLLSLSEPEMRERRGRDLAMIFQDPMSSLNPVLTIGHQIAEPLQTHRGLSRGAARRRAVELLEAVGISDPQKRVREYPHQLSGGMRQRAMLAMALSCDPKVLIADEPTTALDVTTQAEILELLRGLQARLKLAVILISHNFGVVASLADRICVMYAGRVVESGSAMQVLQRPRHPYTEALLRSTPVPGDVAELVPIPGAPPDLSQQPLGCAFLPRCRYQDSRCGSAVPPLTEVEPGHAVAAFCQVD